MRRVPPRSARRFNDQYCANKERKTFIEPEALILKSNARVMSLQDGTSKMSKSAENPNSRINLLDTPDEIARTAAGLDHRGGLACLLRGVVSRH